MIKFAVKEAENWAKEENRIFMLSAKREREREIGSFTRNKNKKERAKIVRVRWLIYNSK